MTCWREGGNRAGTSASGRPRWTDAQSGPKPAHAPLPRLRQRAAPRARTRGQEGSSQIHARQTPRAAVFSPAQEDSGGSTNKTAQGSGHGARGSRQRHKEGTRGAPAESVRTTRPPAHLPSPQGSAGAPDASDHPGRGHPYPALPSSTLGPQPSSSPLCGLTDQSGQSVKN